MIPEDRAGSAIEGRASYLLTFLRRGCDGLDRDRECLWLRPKVGGSPWKVDVEVQIEGGSRESKGKMAGCPSQRADPNFAVVEPLHTRSSTAMTVAMKYRTSMSY